MLNLLACVNTFRFQLFYGKLNMVSQEEFGATLLAIFTSLRIFAYLFSRTIGLSLAGVIEDFGYYILTALGIGFISTIALSPVALKLDGLEKGDFLVKIEKSE